MKKITVINRETGAAESWEAKNVKSYCKPEDIEEMREKEEHSRFSFMIEFKGLKYDLEMYEVDKYDLVVE